MAARSAKSELEKLRDDFREFAYVVSHDLNTPLRAVVGFSEMLSQRYGEGLDERGRRYLDFIENGGKKGQEILEALLQFSRLSTLEDITREAVDVGACVQQCLDERKEKIEAAGAVFTTGALPVVQADAALLARLFGFLIDNAITYSPAKPKIAIEEKSGVFTVRDNGIGIAPEHQETIFRPMRRLHHEDEYPGLGMGLALASRIVERHGGKIWVESEAGRGSAFHFTLQP